MSPFVDLSMSLPSWSENRHIDILHTITPVLREEHIPDDIWPSKPPRGDPYCDTSVFLHPLVSPAVADSWEGSPPMWIATGEERCADGAKVVAVQSARDGVSVHFSEYLGMPHIFPVMLNRLLQSRRCYEEWASSCLDFFQRGSRATSSSCVLIPMPGKGKQSIPFEDLYPLDLKEVRRLVKEGAKRRKLYTGPRNKL